MCISVLDLYFIWSISIFSKTWLHQDVVRMLLKWIISLYMWAVCMTTIHPSGQKICISVLDSYFICYISISSDMSTSRPLRDVAKVDYKALHEGGFCDHDSSPRPKSVGQC